MGLLVTAVERTNAALAAKVEAAGRRFAGVAVEPDYVALEALARLVDEGRLRPHVEHAIRQACARRRGRPRQDRSSDAQRSCRT
jgi:hypothetical protein